MPALESSPRWLTELDYVRLIKLTGQHPPDDLAKLLDTADIVPATEISPDIVTMYTQVRVADAETGDQRNLTVCYPHDAEPNQGFVSVLSPVGTALLGQRVGALVASSTPLGRSRPLRIEAILFQPEATGDYVT